MQTEQLLNTIIQPVCSETSVRSFTQAYSLTAAVGASKKGQLEFVTDKSLFIEVNGMEACDGFTADALLKALHTEAITRQIWQIRWRIDKKDLTEFSPTLRAHGYQLTEGNMARWKNPSFNRDIAMGI